MNRITVIITSLAFALSFFLLPFQVGAQTDQAVLRAQIVELTEQVGALQAELNRRTNFEATCVDLLLSRNLQRGSSGSDVTNVQTYLRNRGYYSGPITGFYGELTVQAVELFKASHGIDWLWTAGTIKNPGVTDGITRALLRKMCQ